MHPQYGVILTFPLQTGDDALAGKEERDIPSRRYQPRTTDRTINFQGEYIAIYNETTKEQLVFEQDVKERKSFMVPKDYTVYIRGADVVSWDG